MLLENEHYKSILPADLYREIEEICGVIKDIQRETAGLLHNSKVPDATAQLNDVLQSTETATHAILDAANFIKKTVDESIMSEPQKQQVCETVMKIYEACMFQDITGQRIKKVLNHLDTLEKRLHSLSEAARAYSQEHPTEKEPAAKTVDTLINGPQLIHETPSQTDVDKLFGNG